MLLLYSSKRLREYCCESKQPFSTVCSTLGLLSTSSQGAKQALSMHTVVRRLKLPQAQMPMTEP